MAPSPRLGPGSRVASAIVALGPLGVLAVALALEPDPRGHGTHERLGLAPCAFRAWTGRPCVSCGMTTAFAWTVRGNLVEAARSSPSGTVLALACLPLSAWLIARSVKGRALGARALAPALMACAVGATGLSVATWLVRLARWGP